MVEEGGYKVSLMVRMEIVGRKGRIEVQERYQFSKLIYGFFPFQKLIFSFF